MKIEYLIEKYFDGETSTEEEKYLKDYFSGKNLPQEHLKYKSMFGIFSDEQKIEISNQSFENELVLKLMSESDTSNRKKLIRYYISGIAATILIMFGIAIFFNYLNNKTNDTKPVNSLSTKKTGQDSNQIVQPIPVEINHKNLIAYSNERVIKSNIIKSKKRELEIKRQQARKELYLALSIITDKLDDINHQMAKLNQVDESMELVNKILNY